VRERLAPKFSLLESSRGCAGCSNTGSGLCTSRPSARFEFSGDSEIVTANFGIVGANLRALGAPIDNGGTPVVVKVSIIQGWATDTTTGGPVYAYSGSTWDADSYINAGTMTFGAVEFGGVKKNGTQELGTLTREMLRVIGYYRTPTVPTGGVLDPGSAKASAPSPEEAALVAAREAVNIPVLARCEL
jgi:hypothetical protein